MATTTHRPRCQRPGWTTQPSTAIHGLTIAHCNGCGATELRAGDLMDRARAGGPHGDPTVGVASRRWSA